MEGVVTRFWTFKDWQITAPTARSMAFGGFIRLAKKKCSVCIDCDLILPDEILLKKTVHPHKLHCEIMPNCTFVKTFQDPRIPHECITINIMDDGPIHPAFQQERQRSFSFPKNDEDAKAFAEAGFFNSLDKSGITCFYCGVNVSDYTTSENPWEIHARSSSNCAFLRIYKTKSFITKAIVKYRSSDWYWANHLKEIKSIFETPCTREIATKILEIGVNLSSPKNVYLFLHTVKKLRPTYLAPLEIFYPAHDSLPYKHKEKNGKENKLIRL